MKKLSIFVLLLLSFIFIVSSVHAVTIGYGLGTYPKFKAYTSGTSTPLVGGLLYTCKPGTTCNSTTTTNLKATYTDALGTAINTNPIVLNSEGEANVWLSDYTKLALFDASGSVVWTVDNVPPAGWSAIPVSAAEVRLSSYASLSAALTAIGTTTITLICDTSSTVSTALSVSSNVSINAENKCLLTKAGSGSLAINGSFDAGLYQIFSGFSTGITFASGKVKGIYPQWWGAKADYATDDYTALQAAITSAVVSTGQRPVVKLVGQYKYGTGLTVTDASYAWGIMIQGESNGLKGDVGAVNYSTTLYYSGVGGTAFKFGNIDTPSMDGQTVNGVLENITIRGTSDASGGLVVGGTGNTLRNVFVFGFTGAGVAGITVTGTQSSFYNVASNGNYYGWKSVLGTGSVASNNANMFYSIVANQNTLYGIYDVSMNAPTYYGVVAQGNGQYGYYGVTIGLGPIFYGGWFENNCLDASTYQISIFSPNDSSPTTGIIQDTVLGSSPGCAAHAYFRATQGLKYYPSYVSSAGSIDGVRNDGYNNGLHINAMQAPYKTGPRAYMSGRNAGAIVTAGSTTASFLLTDADLSFASTWGMKNFIGLKPYEGTADVSSNVYTGFAKGEMASSVLLDGSATTSIFRITFDNNSSAGYFTFHYTGKSAASAWIRVKAERHIMLDASTATIATIGTDDASGTVLPAITWVDNGNNTVDVKVTHSYAQPMWGHAILEGRGGAAIAESIKRGFTISGS